MVGRAKMLKGLREIEKLNADEECLMNLNARVWGLENRIGIIEEIANAKLTQSEEESHQRKKNLTSTGTALRKRLQEGSQEEFTSPPLGVARMIKGGGGSFWALPNRPADRPADFHGWNTRNAI